MSPNPFVWALYSPLRFIAFLVGVLVALSFVLVMTINRSGEAAPSKGETPSYPSIPATTSPISEDPAALEAETMGAKARAVLDRFLALYLGPATKADLRLLKPLATAQLWRGLQATDPANLPSGPPQSIRVAADGAYAASYAVKLPASALLVSVVREPGGPKVAAIEPVRR